VGRVDWTPIPELLVGGSFFYGNSGHNQNVSVAAFGGYTVDIPDTPVSIWELHAQYQSHGLHLRSLFTMSNVGDNDDLTMALAPMGVGGGTGELKAGEAIGGEMLGVYGEVAYDLMPWIDSETEMSLEPFFRYEYLDTQRDLPSGFSKDESKQTHSYTMGVSFAPIPNVVIKADYRNRTAASGGLADEFNLGIGYVF
jgi:opacity protein-like surface antigen